jgi:Major Facilitator Superfamily
VLAVVYGLKRSAQDGIDWTAVLSIAAGLALGATLVRRQHKLADPLIDLHLFRAPAFNAALAANTFGFFVNFGIAVFIAQYLQLVLGLSPFEAGLWTVPYACAFIVGALWTPLFVRRIRPAFVIAGGLALAGIGFAVLTQVDAESSLATVVTGAVVFALGLAPVYTLAADMMVGAAPAERAGAAAGISETSSGSVVHSGSRYSAPSARPSTAARSRTSCLPLSRRRRPMPGGTGRRGGRGRRAPRPFGPRARGCGPGGLHPGISARGHDQCRDRGRRRHSRSGAGPRPMGSEPAQERGLEPEGALAAGGRRC